MSIFGDALGFAKGVGDGAWDGVKGTVAGVGHLAADGYKLAIDSNYRQQAWNSAVNDAKAAANLAATAVTDPSKAASDIGNTASHAWNALESAYNEAAARGQGSEFIGQIFGQGAVLVGMAAIPGGAAADAVGAIGDAGRVTSLLGDAGKLGDAVETAGRVGTPSSDAGKVADASKAAATGVERSSSAIEGTTVASDGTEVGVPKGGRAVGTASGRPFDPDLAGGPIEKLSADGVQISHGGIDRVEQHIDRFGPDSANEAMVNRLRSIANGDMAPTQYDLNYYTHELREFQRYTNLGWESGQPAGADASYELWNNAHTATLEDYGLKDNQLYHPDALK